jgi:hypothetical protein
MGPHKVQKAWSRNLGLLSQAQQQPDQATAAARASFNLEPFALASPQLQDQPGLDHLFAALHNTTDSLSMTPLQLHHLNDACQQQQQQHSYDSEASCDERQHRSLSSDADPAAKKPRISGPSSTTGEANKSSMCMHTACHRHAMYGFQGVPRFCSFHKEQVRQYDLT